MTRDISKKLKIGISGSSGFIGQALMNHLLKIGNDCARIVRVNDGIDYHIKNDENFLIPASEGLVGLDCVVHCGAKVHKKNFLFKKRDSYYKYNVLATVELAKVAHKCGVRRFIFLSTVKVNGEDSAADRPFSIKDIPDPKGFYAESKYEAELRLTQLSKSIDMDIVILRLPLVYGKNSKANFRLLSKFIALNLPMPFKGMNQNKRSLLSIVNLTNFIAKLIHVDIKLNNTFFISDNDDTSIERLVSLISHALGKQPNLFSIPAVFWSTLNKTPFLGNFSRKLTNSLQIDMSETFHRVDWQPLANLEMGINDAFIGCIEKC